MDMEEEAKYYCNKCSAEIKPTDKKCPNCGSDLTEVGRRIELTITETLMLSNEVKVELSKEQLNIIDRVWNAIKDFEVDSITIGFPIGFSVTLKKKKSN